MSLMSRFPFSCVSLRTTASWSGLFRPRKGISSQSRICATAPLYQQTQLVPEKRCPNMIHSGVAKLSKNLQWSHSWKYQNYTNTSNVRTTKQSFNLLGWLVWPCICNRHIDIKITITFFVKRLWSQKLHNLMLKNDVFKMYPKYLCALVQLQLHHRYPILLSVRKTLNNYFYSVTSSLT